MCLSIIWVCSSSAGCLPALPQRMLLMPCVQGCFSAHMGRLFEPLCPFIVLFVIVSIILNLLCFYRVAWFFIWLFFLPSQC